MAKLFSGQIYKVNYQFIFFPPWVSSCSPLFMCSILSCWASLHHHPGEFTVSDLCENSLFLDLGFSFTFFNTLHVLKGFLFSFCTDTIIGYRIIAWKHFLQKPWRHSLLCLVSTVAIEWSKAILITIPLCVSFFLIVQLTYTVVLISAIQQSDSVLHMYIHSFFYILLHYGLSQNIEYSSLCFTVGPCYLFTPSLCL